MHSKIQYLAAAILWDTLLSKKYGGIKAEPLVELLLEKGNSFGLARQYYDFVKTLPEGDLLFQAQIRRLMDNQARLLSVNIQPEDEFQLIGTDGAGTFDWVGSSQLSIMSNFPDDYTEYIFSLQMSEEGLRFQVMPGKRHVVGFDRYIVKLKLYPSPELGKVFYRSAFRIDERAKPFLGQIVDLLRDLSLQASTIEFRQQINRYADIVFHHNS